MKQNYKHRLYCWSKRFVSLLPYQESNTVIPIYLPRLMVEDKQIPRFVRGCATTMTLLPAFRLLPWAEMVQSQHRQWFGQQNVPQSAYIGAFLVKISLKLASISHLRRFLVAHPALIWTLGFPLFGQTSTRHGFDSEKSVPTRQQFSRALRDLDNDSLQTGLTAQVHQLQSLLPDGFGQTISLDTSHIIAWVRENNPRQYVEGRFDKSKQPAGDADCKLGCKKQHNRVVKTPRKAGKAGSSFILKEKEFYWGYASGAVVTKVPDWGEFVLAEMTDTFDKADVRYFLPLMAQAEKRLGFRPRFGTLDAAFDAFYVYDYFSSDSQDNGFAAVPLKQPNASKRLFDEEGMPLCEAKLPMPVRKLYMDRTKAIMSHQRAIHACPLLYPEANGQTCPVSHKQWPKGGCTVNLPTSIGARLRHQIDRHSEQYKAIYKQRTAVERIFSQAKALGMERPKLRNQQAITNYNSMIYLLINLQAIERVLHRLAQD